MDLAVLSNQATPGVCDAVSAFGCYDDDGTFGNPQDSVSCFNNDQISVPFQVHALRFWIGQPPLFPDTLSLRIWSGSAASGPTGMLYEQVLAPGSYVPGENSIFLDSPFEITDEEFCAGVYSGPDTDGYAMYADAGDGKDSFILAPVCGAESFFPLSSIGFNLEYCIEAFIKLPTGAPTGAPTGSPTSKLAGKSEKGGKEPKSGKGSKPKSGKSTAASLDDEGIDKLEYGSGSTMSMGSMSMGSMSMGSMSMMEFEVGEFGRRPRKRIQRWVEPT